jgi:CheY-like chemotaxis protein
MTATNTKIALLEDTDQHREQAKRELTQRGFGVVDTSDPEELIGWIRDDKRGETEAALLDWEINGQILGPEICQRIKAIRPQVQVYAFTVQAGKEATRRALRSGFDDYFYKADLSWEDVAKTILHDVEAVREIIPPLVGFSQHQQDALFRIVTKADRGKGDLDEISGIAKAAFESYLKGKISQPLGELFGVGGKNINIKNILIDRIVTLGVYKYFDYDDYTVLSTLRYTPSLAGKARDNDIRKSQELVEQVLRMIDNKDLTWDDLEDEGYERTTTVYRIRKARPTPEGALFDVAKGSKKGSEFSVQFEWIKNKKRLIVRDGLRFSKALKQLLIRCGLHRRTLNNPDGWLAHERNLLSEWPLRK